MPRTDDKGPAGSAVGGSGTPRPRGRPRHEIDTDAVADAVEKLFATGGFEAVSISATAELLSVSRATLYRTVPSKEQLLGILFERSTRALDRAAREVVSSHENTRDQLLGLVRLQVEGAINMRDYMHVFFGGAGIPPDVYKRWRTWTRRYEKIWRETVRAAMDDGVLERADPVVTTRLLLGMGIWVSRWYRPQEPYRADDITEAAVRLVNLMAGTRVTGRKRR